MVRVNVGVEHLHEPRSELVEKPLVPLDVSRGIHHDRLAPRAHHVGKTPLSPAIELPDLETPSLRRVERDCDRLLIGSVGDHAAFDVLRGEALLVQELRDHRGGVTGGADHDDRPAPGELRDRPLLVLEEIEVGDVHGLEGLSALELPPLEIFRVAHVEEHERLALVGALQELPDADGFRLVCLHLRSLR
jgi:hypothetical protein